jgi:hypothetical protein
MARNHGGGNLQRRHRRQWLCTACAALCCVGLDMTNTNSAGVPKHGGLFGVGVDAFRLAPLSPSLPLARLYPWRMIGLQDLKVLYSGRRNAYNGIRLQATALMDGRDTKKKHQHSKVTSDANHEDEQINVISPELVHTLDVAPLVEAMAQRCGTSRGHNAILGLLGIEDGLQRGKQHQLKFLRRRQAEQQRQQQQQMMAAMTYHRRKSRPSGTDSGNNDSDHDDARQKEEDYDNTSARPLPPIIKLAQTPNEAQAEYQLVQEALHLLLQSRDYPPPTGTVNYNNNQYASNDAAGGEDSPTSKPKGTARSQSGGTMDTAPPIYVSFTSPWANNKHLKNSADEEDDDEWWLEDHIDLNQELASLDLAEILTAEQVARRIFQLHEWSRDKYVQKLAPSICAFVQTIFAEHGDKDTLQNLLSLHNNHNQEDQKDTYVNGIAGAVEIIRGGRSLLDPTGTKSFALRLSSSKFSALETLRMQEEQILGEMIQTNKMDNDTEKNGRDDEQPADQALRAKLERVRDDISYKEQDIKYQLRLRIASANKALRRGLHLMARIDTLCARAALGHHLSGQTPVVSNEGIISVKNFVHPVLALQLQSNSAMSSLNNLNRDNNSVINGANLVGEVVAIDLDLSHTNPSLIISGPNGGGKSCGE